MPGIEISKKDLKKIDAKHKCTFCGFLLNKRMEAKCKHFFCQSCVEIILGWGIFYLSRPLCRSCDWLELYVKDYQNSSFADWFETELLWDLPVYRYDWSIVSKKRRLQKAWLCSIYVGSCDKEFYTLAFTNYEQSFCVYLTTWLIYVM